MVEYWLMMFAVSVYLGRLLRKKFDDARDVDPIWRGIGIIMIMVLSGIALGVISSPDYDSLYGLVNKFGYEGPNERGFLLWMLLSGFTIGSLIEWGKPEWYYHIFATWEEFGKERWVYSVFESRRKAKKVFNEAKNENLDYFKLDEFSVIPRPKNVKVYFHMARSIRIWDSLSEEEKWGLANIPKQYKERLQTLKRDPVLVFKGLMGWWSHDNQPGTQQHHR